MRTRLEASNRWGGGERQTDRQTDLFHLGQLPARVLIVTKILFVAHEDDGDIGTEVFHFGGPFLWNVLYQKKKIEDKDYRLNTYRLEEAGTPDRDS